MRLIVVGAMLLAYLVDAVSQSPNNLCTYESCKAGTRATTYFRKDDSYFACPTREMASYVTMVIGLVSAQAALGIRPNISVTTGEPEYQGESKALLDSLRAKAKVRTFDQAMKACEIGTNNRKVTIVNVPSESLQIVALVRDDGRNASFWMPIFHLVKAK